MRFVSISLQKIKVWCLPVLLFPMIIGLSSCNKGSDEATTITGEWYQESDVDFPGRFAAVTFTVGDSIYMACGYNGTNGVIETYRDVYVYVSRNDSWRQRASLPEDARARKGAVAFTLNGKAYLGLGLAEDGTTYLKDFWSFENTTGEWTKIADFPGNARSGATAFVIDGHGYVGNGSDNGRYYKDFYEYDPAKNEWLERANIPNTGRYAPFSFVIDGKGYIGGGRNGGSLVYTFVEYDPINDVWSTKNDLLDDTKDTDVNDKGYGTIAREQSVSFVLGGKGYIACGVGNADTWQYVPGDDRWYKMNAFEGSNRYGAVGFSTSDGFGHVATGFSGSSYYFGDKWKFDPTALDE